MTANEILQEVLKDPMFRVKYNIPDEELKSTSFDTISNYKIIEVVKEFILLKVNSGSMDNNIYKNIKSIHFGIKD